MVSFQIEARRQSQPALVLLHYDPAVKARDCQSPNQCLYEEQSTRFSNRLSSLMVWRSD
jgi:hypothetical protein